MRWPVLLFFLCAPFLLCVPSLAANCTNNASCPVECPGTAASTTFTAITNTAYTSPAGTAIASTDCLYSFRYDSGTTACFTDHAFHLNNGQCVMNVFKPHGFANSSLLWVICFHGGGGWGGNSEGCFGGGNTSLTPILLIQQYLDYPNPQGGKGIGIIEIDYTLGSQTGGPAVYPQQYQDLFCSESFVLNGDLGFTPTAPLGFYGPSWGGNLAWIAANIPAGGGVYGVSATCLGGADVRAASARAVYAWPSMSYAQPSGASTWSNTNATGSGAINFDLSCSTALTCFNADVATNATPYLQINSTNLAQIRSVAPFFQFTATDQIIEPYWASNAQGNLAYTVNAYQALGLTPAVKVYTQAYCTILGYSNCGGANQGHELGLGNVGKFSLDDAFKFLLNVTGGTTVSL